MQVDLTANDGLKDYGACKCFLAPRTCDQHRKYRCLIPNPKRSWEWTVTANSTKNNGYSNSVHRVSVEGSLDSGYDRSAYMVRPLFKLNPDAVIVPDTITVIIPLKRVEPQMPSKAEPCEHEFEDLYYADFTMTNNNVWVERADGYKKKTLVCCKKCGQVFVKEFEEEGK